MPLQLSDLPHLNAFLNSTSAVLLLAGYYFIRRGQIRRHRNCQVAAIITSTLFLISYLTYHYYHGDTRFLGQGIVRPFYFTVLIAHVILAIVIVPFGCNHCVPGGPWRLHQAQQTNCALDASALAVCVSHRRDRILHALSTYPTPCENSRQWLERNIRGRYPPANSIESPAVAPQHRRSPLPLVIVAALFYHRAFSGAWYFTWFGRGLSDETLKNISPIVGQSPPRSACVDSDRSPHRRRRSESAKALVPADCCLV